MSLGYAEKLTFRDDLGGQLGSEELGESPDSLMRKIDQLAEMVDILPGMKELTREPHQGGIKNSHLVEGYLMRLEALSTSVWTTQELRICLKLSRPSSRVILFSRVTWSDRLSCLSQTQNLSSLPFKQLAS